MSPKKSTKKMIKNVTKKMTKNVTDSKNVSSKEGVELSDSQNRAQNQAQESSKNGLLTLPKTTKIAKNTNEKDCVSMNVTCSVNVFFCVSRVGEP